VEVYLHAFLTSALDGDEWSASRPSPLQTTKTTIGQENHRAQQVIWTWRTEKFVVHQKPVNLETEMYRFITSSWCN